MSRIHLGTIALEPNRWYEITTERWGTIVVSDWLDEVADAGFDGIELWESHFRDAPPEEQQAILDHPLPIAVYNTYVSFDEEDDADRLAVAETIRRTGASKVKWNTGAERDPATIDAYAARLARWAAALDDVELVCECHDGTAMDDPATAARVLAAGSNALVHTHDDPELLRAKFAAYGDHVTHVHVNHLFTGSPRLADIADELAGKVELLRTLGFAGTWTIEFVHGTGGPDDAPAPNLAQAADDLGVLRRILDA
jgi:sugar phosphate isomerase/epimerase